MATGTLTAQSTFDQYTAIAKMLSKHDTHLTAEVANELIEELREVDDEVLTLAMNQVALSTNFGRNTVASDTLSADFFFLAHHSL